MDTQHIVNRLSAPALTLYRRLEEKGPASIPQLSRDGTAKQMADQIKAATHTEIKFTGKGRKDTKAVAIAALELAIRFPNFRIRLRRNANIMEFAKVDKQRIIDTRKLFYPDSDIDNPSCFTPLTPETAVLTTFIRDIHPDILKHPEDLMAHITGEFGDNKYQFAETALMDASFQEWRFLYMDELLRKDPYEPPPTPQVIPDPADPLTTTPPEEKTLTELDAQGVINRRQHVDYLKAGDLLTKEGRVAFFALLGADNMQPMLLRANAVKEIGKIRGDYEPRKNQSKAPVTVMIAGQQQQVSLTTDGEEASRVRCSKNSVLPKRVWVSPTNWATSCNSQSPLVGQVRQSSG